MGVGTLCQTLKMYAHVLLVGEIAGVDSEIVDGITVFVPLNDRSIPGSVLFHATDCRLVVGNVVGDGLVPELGIGDALVVRLALTFKRGYALFKFRLFQQVGVAAENSHILREVHAVLFIHRALVDSSRSECARFKLVDECRLAMEKIELVGIQRLLNGIDDYIHLIISI